MKLVIRLPSNRDRVGRIVLLRKRGVVACGPFAVAARACEAAANANGNPTRNPLLPYGDTPVGRYRVLGVIPTGRGTRYPSAEYGPHGAVAIEAVSGDAALAEANGRFVLLIHGGARGRLGRLRPTNGCLRMADQDMRELVRHVRLHPELPCICAKTARLGNARRVDTDADIDEGDPPFVQFPHETRSIIRPGDLSRRSFMHAAGSSIGAFLLGGIPGLNPGFVYADTHAGTHAGAQDEYQPGTPTPAPRPQPQPPGKPPVRTPPRQTPPRQTPPRQAPPAPQPSPGNPAPSVPEPAVPGVIPFLPGAGAFNVKIIREAASDTCTMGYLAVNNEIIAYALERPWKNNQRFISAIPAGTYKGILRYDHSDKGNHWRIELTGVPDRKRVQIHIGNWPKDTEGCILVGGGVGADGCSLTDSAKAYKQMKKKFYGTENPNICPDLKIAVTIEDGGGSGGH